MVYTIRCSIVPLPSPFTFRAVVIWKHALDNAAPATRDRSRTDRIDHKMPQIGDWDSGFGIRGQESESGSGPSFVATPNLDVILAEALIPDP